MVWYVHGRNQAIAFIDKLLTCACCKLVAELQMAE